MISSVSRLCSLCIPTGMPRPLSSTVTELSAWIVTRDVVGVADLRLVDRVVDELEDHVVQAREVVGVPDVHAGPLADGLQALQELDRVGGVGGAHRTPVTRSTARRARGAATATRAAPHLQDGRRPPRPARRTAPRSSGARSRSGGQRSRNSSTQPSERPGVEVVGARRAAARPRAFATALPLGELRQRHRAGDLARRTPAPRAARRGASRAGRRGAGPASE